MNECSGTVHELCEALCSGMVTGGWLYIWCGRPHKFCTSVRMERFLQWQAIARGSEDDEFQTQYEEMICVCLTSALL